MRAKMIFISGLMLTSSMVYGMDGKEFERLITAVQAKDFGVVESFLHKNEMSLHQDPEYYVVLLNYVVSKGDRTGVVVAKGEPQNGDFALQDPKSKKVVGFLGPRGEYDNQLIVDGISKTQNALPFFKSRLDIHFGIVAVAETIKRWDIQADQLVEILRVSKEIDNKWTWGSIGSMSGDPKEFMLENVQSRVSTLFKADNPEMDEALLKISQALIQYYPDVIYGYSNLGVLYLAKKEYEEADRYLKKAIKIDPNDEIVKKNIEFLKNSRKG